MRTAALLAAAVALSAAGVAAAPTAQPKLTLLSTSPFKVRGEHFRPSENVLVTLTAGRKHGERRVRASLNGSFVVVFPAVAVDRCTGYLVRALGSRGSVATLRSPPLLCPPRPSIP